MQLLIVLALAVAASATYSYAPTYSAYGGYDSGAYGYSNLGGYASSLYGAPYTYGSYGDSYAYAPESYSGGSSYGGVAYVAAKPAVSYVAPAIQKYVAPTYSYVSQPAVSYVSKPAVSYVAAAPRVEKFITIPSYYPSGYNRQRPVAPVKPSSISFTLGSSGAFSQKPQAPSHTTRKDTVPTAAEYVPKPITSQKPSKAFTPAEEYVPKPIVPQQPSKGFKPAEEYVPKPIITQQPSRTFTPARKTTQSSILVVPQQQQETSYRNVAPGEGAFSTYEVKSGSRVSIGDQTYVVVPVADYDGNKESTYTHSLVGDDKSSISHGSFFPFPSDTYSQDKPTDYKYPVDKPVFYSPEKVVEVPYVYNAGQPSYGTGYGQNNPSGVDLAFDRESGVAYGSDYTDEKSGVQNPGSYYSVNEASATLYSPEHKQDVPSYGSEDDGDRASAGSYDADNSDNEDSAVSYGSDYSGGIGSADQSHHSGVKTNRRSYGSK